MPGVSQIVCSILLFFILLNVYGIEMLGVIKHPAQKPPEPELRKKRKIQTHQGQPTSHVVQHPPLQKSQTHRIVISQPNTDTRKKIPRQNTSPLPSKKEQNPQIPMPSFIDNYNKNRKEFLSLLHTPACQTLVTSTTQNSQGFGGNSMQKSVHEMGNSTPSFRNQGFFSQTSMQGNVSGGSMQMNTQNVGLFSPNNQNQGQISGQNQGQQQGLMATQNQNQNTLQMTMSSGLNTKNISNSGALAQPSTPNPKAFGLSNSPDKSMPGSVGPKSSTNPLFQNKQHNSLFGSADTNSLVKTGGPATSGASALQMPSLFKQTSAAPTVGSTTGNSLFGKTNNNQAQGNVSNPLLFKN